MLSDVERQKIRDSLLKSAESQVDIIMSAYDKLYDALPSSMSEEKRMEVVNQVMNEVSNITLQSYATVGDNLTAKLQDTEFMKSIIGV